MTLQEQYIERLRSMVEAKFGRSITTDEDCRDLVDAVAQATNMRLDERNYASLFMPKEGVAPRPVTLSALTRYVGYDCWSEFCTSADVMPAEDIDKIPAPRYWGVTLLTIVAIVVVAISAIIMLRDNRESKDMEVSRVAQLVEEHSDMWLARTQEECNAVRVHADSKEYSKRVEEFIEEYCTTLYDEVSSELILRADEENIEISVEDIALYAERITASCCRMCEALIEEQTQTER